MGQMKRCAKCDSQKPLAEFYVRKDRYAGQPRGVCKSCHNETNKHHRETIPEEFSKRNRWYHIFAKYGLTKVQWEAIFLHQECKCAACGRATPGAKWWHTDHDPRKQKGDPGFVRGILCHSCNIGIGVFKENAEQMRLAAEYVVKHG